jgi:threonine synthase
MKTRFSYIDHLKCSECQRQYEADQLQTVSTCCGRPLLACYDLAALAREVSPEDLAGRAATMWRYHELLPVRDEQAVLSLGEGMTPLLAMLRLGPAESEEQVNLLIKDEGLNPTGSFKARGMAAAVSRASELGVKGLVTPTAGNAGAAMAAYAARAGLKAYVALPEDTPRTYREQALRYGAEVELVRGLISDAGQVAARVARERGWFNVATLKEPYRAEGKKTMGLELAEQLGWRLPEVIIYPAGGGTGIVGMWKAFQELRELGWLRDERLPRLIMVQAGGCAPLVKAFLAGKEEAEEWPADAAHTKAMGLRVPSAIGDRLILRAIRESGGTALTVSDVEMVRMVEYAAKRGGIWTSLEAAATLAAYHELLKRHILTPSSQTVLFFTGSGWSGGEAPEMWERST